MVAVAVGRIRRGIVERVRTWWPQVRDAIAGLRAAHKLALLIGGSVATEILFAAALGLFAHGLGYDISLVDLLVINMSVSLLASFIPVPGGVGVVEFGLTLGLTAAGMSPEPALAAVLLYRISTFYLPPVVGLLRDALAPAKPLPLMGRRAEELKARAKQAAERGEELRRRHGAVDVVYVIVERDGDLGGGIMSGALAYRLFIWLLPFGLVVVGGIGLAASAVSESPESAARSVGISGLVANSIAEASQGSSRWYALAIGVPVLVWASRSLLRALLVVHRLVWGDLRRVVPKPTFGASIRLLVLLIAYFAIREAANWIESWTGSVVLSTLVGLGSVFAWWLFLSWRLPHGNAPWHALLPGAAVVAVGMELISIAGIYLIAPRVESSQSAYGALGIAATLLFGLYIVSRLIVASAVLNATVWDRRSGARPPAGLGSSDS